MSRDALLLEDVIDGLHSFLRAAGLLEGMVNGLLRLCLFLWATGLLEGVVDGLLLLLL